MRHDTDERLEFVETQARLTVKPKMNMIERKVMKTLRSLTVIGTSCSIGTWKSLSNLKHYIKEGI